MICAAVMAALYIAGGLISLGSTTVAADEIRATEPPAATQAPVAVVRASAPILPQATPEPDGAEITRTLLQIAMAEAEGESTEGKALVMLVVLNRVKSADFPDSVEAVIFQTNQFQVTEPGGRYWTTTPDRDCYEALAMVEDGWDESAGALYFESVVGECWHSRNLEYLFTVGNHDFYK